MTCKTTTDLNRYYDYMESIDTAEARRYLYEARESFKESILGGINKQVKVDVIPDFMDDLSFEALMLVLESDYDEDFVKFFSDFKRGYHQGFAISIRNAISDMADKYVGELE